MKRRLFEKYVVFTKLYIYIIFCYQTVGFGLLAFYYFYRWLAIDLGFQS
jgi:hypothetical protein